MRDFARVRVSVVGFPRCVGIGRGKFAPGLERCLLGWHSLGRRGKGDRKTTEVNTFLGHQARAREYRAWCFEDQCGQHKVRIIDHSAKVALESYFYCFSGCRNPFKQSIKNKYMQPLRFLRWLMVQAVIPPREHALIGGLGTTFDK